jgi:hypothetical protein
MLATLPRPASAQDKTPEDKTTCRAGENNSLSEAATCVRRKTEELFNEMHMSPPQLLIDDPEEII